MHQFEVDDEVVEAVWQRANPRPFENLSFNSALRRVLGLASEPERDVTPSGTTSAGTTSGRQQETDERFGGEAPVARPRRKAPKANLRKLVAAGLLRNAEELYLIDYQGKRVADYAAKVSGTLLLFKGEHYSMSDLARDLLKKVGFRSHSVRGPAHWANVSGVSVKDLWQQLLDARNGS